MDSTIFDMERGIAKCRVSLSVVVILTSYLDPTAPTLTRWIPLSGGSFVVNRYWVAVALSHLGYSLTLLYLQNRALMPAKRFATIATCGDVLFAAALALVTEGTTSPFYAFFAFAVVSAGLRSGLAVALVVTCLSAALYTFVVVAAAPTDEEVLLVMRAAYVVITGCLVGYLAQERLNQETRIRNLETNAQRERIARSLHDGYAQALAAVNLRLGTCQELLRRGQSEDALAELGELQSGVNREHDELRAYIRSLIDLADTGGGRGKGEEPRVEVRADFGGPAADVEHALLIMIEGLRNVRRHAHARSAAIEARRNARELVLAITDDGVGFPDGAVPPWSMASRVAERGGRLTLGNDGESGGRVVIHLPQA